MPGIGWGIWGFGGDRDGGEGGTGSQPDCHSGVMQTSLHLYMYHLAMLLRQHTISIASDQFNCIDLTTNMYMYLHGLAYTCVFDCNMYLLSCFVDTYIFIPIG